MPDQPPAEYRRIIREFVKVLEAVEEYESLTMIHAAIQMHPDVAAGYYDSLMAQAKRMTE